MINDLVKVHDYTIFPNPSNGDINFQLESGLLPKRIEILDLSGRVCKDVRYKKTINLNVLAGTYFIRLIGDETHFKLKKIIIN